VTVIEVDPADHVHAGEPLQGSQFFNAHGMQPDVVFGVLGMLDAQAGRIFVVGCEPATVDYGMGLSERVAAAVDEAVRIVLAIVAKEAANVPWHTR
jgi:hydrogenase maturation protease